MISGFTTPNFSSVVFISPQKRLKLCCLPETFYVRVALLIRFGWITVCHNYAGFLAEVEIHKFIMCGENGAGRRRGWRRRWWMGPGVCQPGRLKSYVYISATVCRKIRPPRMKLVSGDLATVSATHSETTSTQILDESSG